MHVSGNKASENLANGVVSTYTYNNANRITNISTTKDNVNISSHEYSYYLDGSDACKTRTENGIIETTSYKYDGLKRLTEETVSVGNIVVDTYSYEYDDYGNRSKMTATGSENYITEYDYTDSNGNYTTLLQKETRTIEVADIEDSFTGLANNPVERLNNLNSTSNVKETIYTY